MARINVADAHEIVHSSPTRPTTVSFGRARDLDPRHRKGRRPGHVGQGDDERSA